MSEAGEITEDGFLGGRLRLRQPRRGHRAGHDGMLLAAATALSPGDRVVEFGAGVGAAGLALALRGTAIDLTLVEVDAALCALAADNIALNRAALGAAKVRTTPLDVTAPADAFAAAGLGPDSVDRVLMNPPFNAPGRHQPSPNPQRRDAHVALATTLGDWVHAARRILKPGGTLTLIWRADGLSEVLAGLDKGFGAVAVLPVHGKPDAPAIRVLVRAIKGGRGPLVLLPPLRLNDEAGRPGPEAEAVLSGRDILPLARR